jgi:hypothetical protein
MEAPESKHADGVAVPADENCDAGAGEENEAHAIHFCTRIIRLAVVNASILELNIDYARIRV